MNIRIAFALAGALVATTVAPTVQAQTAPISRTVPLTFTGVVTNDVTNTIMVRQPDGTTVPFTGPVPDYPYKKGDTVTLSFNATLPTKAFYEPGGPYRGEVAADGIYRLSLGAQSGSPGFTPGPGGVGAITVPDVSGPISGNANRYGSYARMIVVYDSKADSYSLEYPNGRWSVSDLNGPSYAYDQASGALTSTAFSCRGGTPSGCNENNPGGFALIGDENSASANVPIWSPVVNNDINSSYIDGVFSMLINGSWNLPTWNGSGGSTQVPEPGMALLFGGGALALLRRRRKAAA